MSVKVSAVDFHVHPVVIEEALPVDRYLEKKVREVYHIGTAIQPLDALIKMLKAAGIDKAVLLSIATLEDTMPPNESIKTLVEKGKGMFIGFAGLNPAKGDEAIDALEKAHSEGFKGVKLYPPLQGFKPNDRKLYTFYERAQHLNMPLLFHTGVSWIRRVELAHCHPLEIEDVVVNFPDLKVILAHMGFPWVWEAAMIAVKYENVYLDLSGVFTGTPKEHIFYVFNKILTPGFVSRFLADKIVFGSDWPRMEPFKMAEAVRSLPIEKSVIDKIMRLNALRILEIEEELT
ncbi:MAG: amidohydrolase family protein [Candidatus Bathyarchaeia archaeon]